jgi:predicted RNase H-like HicB family nuclease
MAQPKGDGFSEHACCGLIEAMTFKLDYPVLIEPLRAEDGGGFAAFVPDLPGCMTDGETPEEALANVRDAIESWIDEARALGRPIPPPTRRHAAAE